MENGLRKRLSGSGAYEVRSNSLQVIVSQTEDPCASTLILYLTPAENKVYLRFDHTGFEPETISIALFDLTGQCIETFMGSEQYNSLVGMARGLYIVVV